MTRGRNDDRHGPPAASSGSEAPARLIDDPDAPPTAAWAVELLRSVPRYQAPPGRKQRVRLGMAQPVRRRAPLLLRPAIVVGVLIGCGAIASAALGDSLPRWVNRAYQQIVGSAVPPRTAEAPAEPRARTRRAQRPGTEADVVPAAAREPPVAPPAPLAQAPAVTPAPAAAPTTGRGAAPPPRGDAVVSLPARRARTTAASEDTAPVLEAMRALRVEQNPARARVLLARYLDRYPRGTLVEEALAMSIEAAIARGDADAAALGARYLKLYPAGPFRALARQAVARASSASTSAR
jgi:hypothetical protein